jgi:hypothetical protein
MLASASNTLPTDLELLKTWSDSASRAPDSLSWVFRLHSTELSLLTSELARLLDASVLLVSAARLLTLAPDSRLSAEGRQFTDADRLINNANSLPIEQGQRPTDAKELPSAVCRRRCMHDRLPIAALLHPSDAGELTTELDHRRTAREQLSYDEDLCPCALDRRACTLDRRPCALDRRPCALG